ncbi:hypothetical protein [Azospirillum sp. B510]|uniref:hypothetical protein n=1 Tax=Azospirillum sp. (strain B510) TaxID=137722 RepID=UPI0011D17347|nr:hypothetical protein [Azospirillum sp. B510]
MSEEHALESGKGPRGALPRHMVMQVKKSEGGGDATLDGIAKAYVLVEGRRTGHEHLYAYERNEQKVIFRHTDHLDDKVWIPEDFHPRLLNRSDFVVLHHNHPNGSSFSATDLRIFSHFAGIKLIFAHGHDDSSYQAEIRQRGNLDRALDAVQGMASDWYRSNAHPLVACHNDTAWLTTHIMCLILHAADIIDYRFDGNAECRPRYDFAGLLGTAFISASATQLRTTLRSGK